MRAHARPYQVVLITIDALRADHLGSYGYGRDTSPTIDRIAGENVMLDWVFSPVSFALSSHYSMMTSRYPSFHSVQFRGSGCADLDSAEPTAAEVLSRNGFATGAFVSSSVLGAANAMPITRGFDVYDEETTHRESGRKGELRRWAKDTNTTAVEWMAKHRNDRFFCWVHYMDAHGPYDAPHPFGDYFLKGIKGLQPRPLEVVDDGETGGIPAYQVLNARTDGFGNFLSYEDNYHYYVASYDGGIRYVDSCVARLIEDLVRLGIYDNVLLVVTSNHGEALGENGVYFCHGLTVGLDQTRVPLVFKFPQRSGIAPVRVGAHSSLIDIVPTVLDLVGAQMPGAQGVSLLPLCRGDDAHRYDGRIVFSETETQLAAMDLEYQVLMGRGVPHRLQFPYYHPEAPGQNRVAAYRGFPNSAPENVFSRLGGLAMEYDARAREARETACAPHEAPGGADTARERIGA
jgi:arylsulfatase A-like enzyme